MYSGKPVIKRREATSMLRSALNKRPPDDQRPVMGTFLWLSPRYQYTIYNITVQPFSTIHEKVIFKENSMENISVFHAVLRFGRFRPAVLHDFAFTMNPISQVRTERPGSPDLPEPALPDLPVPECCCWSTSPSQ